MKKKTAPHLSCSYLLKAQGKQEVRCELGMMPFRWDSSSVRQQCQEHFFQLHIMWYIGLVSEATVLPYLCSFDLKNCLFMFYWTIKHPVNMPYVFMMFYTNSVMKMSRKNNEDLYCAAAGVFLWRFLCFVFLFRCEIHKACRCLAC